MRNWDVKITSECKTEILVLEERNDEPIHVIKVFEHRVPEKRYSAVYTIPDKSNTAGRTVDFWIQLQATNMSGAKLEAIVAIKQLVNGIVSEYKNYYNQIEEAVTSRDMVLLKKASEID